MDLHPQNRPARPKTELVRWALAHAAAEPYDDLSTAIAARCPERAGWSPRTIRTLTQWICERAQEPRPAAGLWCSDTCRRAWAADYAEAIATARATDPGATLAQAGLALARAQPGAGTLCLACGAPLLPSSAAPPLYLLGVVDPDGDRRQLAAYLGGGAHFVGLPLGGYQVIATPAETRAWLQGRLASGLRGGGMAFPTLAAALADLLDLSALRPADPPGEVRPWSGVGPPPLPPPTRGRP